MDTLRELEEKLREERVKMFQSRDRMDRFREVQQKLRESRVKMFQLRDGRKISEQTLSLDSLDKRTRKLRRRQACGEAEPDGPDTGIVVCNLVPGSSIPPVRLVPDRQSGPFTRRARQIRRGRLKTAVTRPPVPAVKPPPQPAIAPQEASQRPGG